MRAKIEAEDKSTIQVFGDRGIFDRKSGMLTLQQKIMLKSTTGYELRLTEAVIDTTTGSIVSEKPVEVQGQQGHAECQWA